MAKKESNNVQDDGRQSRKDFLIRRRQNEQTRQVYIGVGIVGGLILLILLVGIVNELLISPNQAVATVNGEEISLREWQERVEYERAQRIILLENQLEVFDGDVGIIQQFASQPILELQNSEELGQIALDLMVNELVIRQVAQERGISVSDAEIDEFIGETFNYFGGESPTAIPTGTQTPIPTPSITPIPTAVITDVVPTDEPIPTATAGPTGTPFPTATPVSAEAYNEELSNLLTEFDEYGISEETYREVIRHQLYREKLADDLVVELEIQETALHVNAFFLFFDTQESADEALAMVNTEGFLTTWNTLRSGSDETLSGQAFELLDRTEDELAQTLGVDVAPAVFALNEGQPSGILTDTDMQSGTSRYFIAQVSGFSDQDLTEQELQQAKFTGLTNFVDGRLAGGVDYTEAWRGRVPTQPRLDPKFLQQPTPTPASAGEDAPTIPEVPVDEVPVEEEAPAEEESGE